MLSEKPVAFITGASRGIGKIIAHNLAKQGFNIALLARTVNQLDETAALCRKEGAETLILSCDITDQVAVKKSIAEIMSTFGKINVLINNHGMMDYHFISAENAAKTAEVITINLQATTYITSLVLPHIVDNNSSPRAIIFISSLAAKNFNAGSAAYSASKQGLVGFAHALFEEIREQAIKVSVICPGYVNTERQQGKNLNPEHMIQPDDIAQTITFIINSPATVCPIEILLRPQKTPHISAN